MREVANASLTTTAGGPRDYALRTFQSPLVYILNTWAMAPGLEHLRLSKIARVCDLCTLQDLCGS